VILVSAGFPAYGDYMGITYAEPLEAVGAVPLHMPYVGDVRAALGVADGVVLGFGSDIAPARYGGAGHEKLTPVSERRDAFELGLAAAVIEAGLPVLGICRGMQLINVYSGGSLHRDLAGFYREDPETRTILPHKRIVITPGTRVARLLDHETRRVNALHSQAIDRLGRGVRVAARDRNGIVQAIEHEALPFLVGVQWHPEYLPQVPEQRELFNALIAAAKRAPVRDAGDCEPAAAALTAH